MYVLLPGFSHIRTPGVSGFSGLSRISDLAFFWIFQNFSRFFRISFPETTSKNFLRCLYIFLLYMSNWNQKKHDQIAVQKIHRMEHFGIIALEHANPVAKPGAKRVVRILPNFSGWFPDTFFCLCRSDFLDLQWIPTRSLLPWFPICHQVPMAVKHDRRWWTMNTFDWLGLHRTHNSQAVSLGPKMTSKCP